MKRFLLAHDLGTSGNKATLFDLDGRLLQSTIYFYETNYFNTLWAEQNPADWWKAVCATSRELIEKSGISPEDIGAVSFSGQMMGCLCVDRDGRPLRPSIIWADQRSQEQSDKISSRIAPRDFYKIAGQRNSSSHGFQKLMWVKENQPEIYEKTYKVLQAKDYIVLKLTGKFYSEYTDASGFGCLDLNKLEWSQEILEHAEIDPDKLPVLKPSTFVAGGVTEEAAALTGLAPGTPVVLGGGDGVCTNVGVGSVSPGKTFGYIGSSAWISTTTEKPIYDEDMRTGTFAHIVPGLYAPNGAMQSAGSAYSWLKNTICRYESELAKQQNADVYELINSEIEKSPPGANGIIFLPYLLGERSPRWNGDAKACFIGMKMENKREDILRSVLEGITLNLSIILEIFRQHVAADDMLVIGGGAKGAVWRQMMADIFNAKIRFPRLLDEATSMGAAVTGGVGAGLFTDFSAIDRFLDVAYEHTPDQDAVTKYAGVKSLFEGCYTSLLDVFPSL